jgi:hypothetical protein
LLKLLLQFNNVIRGLEPRIHCAFEAMLEKDEQPVDDARGAFCAVSIAQE